MKEVKRGDILLVELPEYKNYTNTSVQKGLRPVIVVSNNMANKFSPVIQVVPITSKKCKNNLPTHILIGVDSGLLEDSMVLVEQLTIIDKKFIRKLIGECSRDIIDKIDMAILIQTGLLDKIRQSILNGENKEVAFA